MAIEQFKVGLTLSGLLVDDIKETPYVGAILTVNEAGVIIEIPYMSYDTTGQFDHVTRWFDSQEPPTNLLFISTEGPISLYGLRWNGHTIPSSLIASRGTIRVGQMVNSRREGQLTDPLTMTEVRGWLDRLNRWSRLTSVRTDIAHDAGSSAGVPRGVTLTVESTEAVRWKQGDATVSLVPIWRSGQTQDGHSRVHKITDDVLLASAFPESRSFSDHLAEQRKVANLLVLLYGSDASFRRHQLMDERFVLRTLNGQTHGKQLVDVLSDQTVRDFTLPLPDENGFQQPLAQFTHIGAEGMESWASNYDSWKRYILPAVNVFRSKNAIIEDVVVSTSMSLEAAGHRIGPRPGDDSPTAPRQKPSMATLIYRCLDLLGLAWGDHIASPLGLAKAIANNYNSVKHADRGDFPDAHESILVSETNKWLIRLLALHLTGKGDGLLADYRKSDQLSDLRHYFESFGLMIAADGTWQKRTY